MVRKPQPRYINGQGVGNVPQRAGLDGRDASLLATMATLIILAILATLAVLRAGGYASCPAKVQKKCDRDGRTGAVISCKCLPLVKISIRFQLL